MRTGRPGAMADFIVDDAGPVRVASGRFVYEY